ncbi:MAG: sigma 54-dependent transcriptional regulator, partial [Myxococcota bacterium]
RDRGVSLVDETLGDDSERLDLFDRVQLHEVLRVCRANSSLSEAGRELFAVSRTKRSSTNDSDRVRKYLARFGIDRKQLTEL